MNSSTDKQDTPQESPTGATKRPSRRLRLSLAEVLGGLIVLVGAGIVFGLY